MQVLQFSPLATGTAGYGLYNARNTLYTIEAAQPEGAQMALVMDMSYPASVLGGSTVEAFTQNLANGFNAAAHAGGPIIQQYGSIDPPTGQAQYATATGGSQLTIRWTKGQIGILIVILLLAAVAVGLYVWVQGWRFEKGQFVNVNTGSTEGPGTFFGTTLPNEIGKLGQSVFNYLPLYILGGGLAFLYVIGYIAKSHQTVVQIVDPYGHRAEEAHQKRLQRVRRENESRKQRDTDRRHALIEQRNEEKWAQAEAQKRAERRQAEQGAKVQAAEAKKEQRGDFEPRLL